MLFLKSLKVKHQRMTKTSRNYILCSRVSLYVYLVLMCCLDSKNSAVNPSILIIIFRVKMLG